MNKVITNNDVLLASLKVLFQNLEREQSLSEEESDDITEIFWTYVEVAEMLLPLIPIEKNLSKTTMVKLQKVIECCVARAEDLSQIHKGEVQKTAYDSSVINRFLTLMSNYSIEKAVTFDEQKKYDVSLKWYLCSIEYFMEKKQKGFPIDQKMLLNIFDRSEKIKKMVSRQSLKKTRKLTSAEIEVLKKTSTMNKIRFLPFIQEDIVNEKFHLYDKFDDPDGKLKLSNTQKKYFHAWKRPHQFIRGNVYLIKSISPYTITQSVVTDCSFVSSLIVTASYERRFNKPLITKCIFPQKNGVPIYNQSGKYMVKLFFNGVYRKVMVDDYFPVDSSNNLLCSHSSNKNELWISLIEKAFIKVNGGYNFPGSNSGVDLHNLTGWVPESIKIKKPEFENEKTWNRLKIGHQLGQCLITISTGANKNGEYNYEEVGLSEGHAYAVLDVREELGIRLLLVKNPWNKRRWNGKFSPNDRTNWTPQLRKKLNYDLIGALQYDNGVFWIDYDSMLKYYENIHYSWNPAMFDFSSRVHASWQLLSFLQTDEYNISRNPQYKLLVGGKGTTWVLLSKHQTDINDDDDYLSVLIYPNTRGRRVYKRQKPLNKVVYSNNQHRRIFLKNDKANVTAYTIVVSQYEKIRAVSFSLSAYSSVNCKLTPIPMPKFCCVVKGAWKGSSAAGSVNNSDTYKNNPQYLMKVNFKTNLNLTLEAKFKSACVNLIVFKNNGKRVESPTTDIIYKSSGTYINSFCYCYLENVNPNIKYTVVVSTFDKGAEHEFQLCVEGEKGAAKLTSL